MLLEYDGFNLVPQPLPVAKDENTFFVLANTIVANLEVCDSLTPIKDREVFSSETMLCGTFRWRPDVGPKPRIIPMLKSSWRLLAIGISSVLTAFGVASADSYQVLYSFSGSDGASPTGLMQSLDGTFYGVAANGGNTTACDPDGCGTLFKSDASGNLTTLHTFVATDGAWPTGLIEAQDGNLYGSAISGGQSSGGGAGVLFRLTPSGSFNVLYAFVGGFACCDGASPTAHPIQAKDGNLYGTTMVGGDYRDIDHQGGFGTVYRYNLKTSKLKIIHSFNLDGNGIYPNGPLLQGRDGFLYGTTREGASLFKIDTSGNFSVVSQLPGMQPLAGVIRGDNGSLYGTEEGITGGGSVYKVDSNDVLTIVNPFEGGDGYRPNFPVMRSNGFYYGTTPEGGLLDFQGGDIFRLNSKGSLRVLHSFLISGSGGFAANTALILGQDGALYGTTGAGGVNGRGTLFRVDAADLGEVASISVKPQTIISGQSATGKVKLFHPAPKGGTVVTLAAQEGQIIIPPNVTVKEGNTVAKFRIDTWNIGAEVTLHIYASIAGQGTRTSVTVTPP